MRGIKDVCRISSHPPGIHQVSEPLKAAQHSAQVSRVRGVVAYEPFPHTPHLSPGQFPSTKLSRTALPTKGQDPGGLTCSRPDTFPSHQPPGTLPAPSPRPVPNTASPPLPQELQPGPAHGAPLGLGPHLRDGADPGRLFPRAARRAATPGPPARTGSRAAIQAPRQVPGERRDLLQSANERAGRARWAPRLPDVTPVGAGPRTLQGADLGGRQLMRLSKLGRALVTSSFERKTLT